MQFGWCGGFELAEDAAAAELDYLELQVAPLNLEAPGALEAAKEKLADLPLRIAAASLLYPRDMRLVGPDADQPRANAYFAKVVDLLATCGAEVVVFGSGFSRRVPEGFSREAAEAQLVALLNANAEALEGSGITLVVEPVNQRESNIITKVAEAVALAEKVGRPEIRALADFYHMDEEHEPLREAERFAPALGHVHVADTGRLNPGSGQYAYPAFFGALKRGGYQGLISAECSTDGDRRAAMTASAKFLKAQWTAA
jgi:sugar phosphate isomerase/epimerase